LLRFLLLALVSLAVIGCGDREADPDPTELVALSDVALIGEDRNYPTVDQSCWDWFPEGDGLIYALIQDGTHVQSTLEFPLEKVEKGRAIITGLGEIKTGQVLYLRYQEGIRPFAKAIVIDPDLGGVQIAIVGNITGTC
jgi:hypothetical protein